MPKLSVNNRIERLESLLKRGFKRMDRRFDEVTDEIGRVVKHGFDHVDERFEQVGEQFNRVDERFAVMDKRFDTVDADLGSINRRLAVAVYQNELVELDGRVTTLERRAGISKK